MDKNLELSSIEAGDKMIMKRITSLFTQSLMLASLLVISCGRSSMPFNTKWYNKHPDKAAGRFIESKNLQTIKSVSFSNIAILEFNVEYHVNIPDEVCAELTDELYDIFVKALEDGTDLEIIEGKAIANSPIYQSLWAKKSYQDFNKKGKDKRKKTMLSKTHPASHLSIISPIESRQGNQIRNSDNKWLEPGVMEDIGAEAILKVYTVIDVFQKKGQGRLVILPKSKKPPLGSTIDLAIGYTKSNVPGVGFTEKDGRSYIYYYNNYCSFELKKPLVSYEKIRVKHGVYNRDEFVSRTQEMFRIYSEMIVKELATNF